MNHRVLPITRFLSLILVFSVLFASAYAAGDLITTTFAGGNGCAGNMFDVAATNTLTITAFDVNFDAGTHMVSVYYKAGSYVGSETTAGAWTLLGSDTITSSAENTPTRLNVGGLTIPAGETYALYITGTDTTINYTNGTNTYSNADVTLTLGIGLCGLFSGTNNPRTWNGTMYYTPGLVGEPPAPITGCQLVPRLKAAWSATRRITLRSTTNPATSRPASVLNPGTYDRDRAG